MYEKTIAQEDTVCYSIVESAEANNGNIDSSTLYDLMPRSKDLPEECYKRC